MASKSIPDHILDRIRQATDIVALVRAVVPLRKSGNGLVGLCPFHKEKTPSFHVNPEMQIFKCFGCGVGGDVFSFVQRIEGLSFPEAIRHLAEQANIELPDETEQAVPKSEKTSLYDAHTLAAKVFHYWLEQPEGKQALEYLFGRGLTVETIKEFQIGYSRDSWDALLTAARNRNFSTSTMLTSGLAVTSENGQRTYDRFRNRVMFPIRDAHERVIGFGARCLDGSEPKYLNSPETPLFSKGRTLYALDKAKSAFREKRQAIVVEGYMDVVMLHQHGVKRAVATLGTALSADHVRLLRRHVDEVALVFDADNAGQSAANRSVDVFLAEELPVRVATLMDGLDPDEFVQKNGAEAFYALIESAPDGMGFKMNRALAGTGRPDPRVLDEVLASISLLPNSASRHQEVRRLAGSSGISEISLVERLNALEGARYRRQEAPAAETVTSIKSGNPEMELIRAMLAYPQTALKARRLINPEHIRNEHTRALIARIFELASSNETFDAALLLARTQEEALRELIERALGIEAPASDDPDAWCAELANQIEAQRHGEIALELHRTITASTGSAQSQDEALLARLQALRDAQRVRGKLELKRTTFGG